ncbi:MAG: NAD-dependent epimerase/dehydratase family protein [Alphaproteobacteria bacterium PA3]|nr:MAG: NAD-dependent epimerase/dehydratase family protein [Alphaproteobacteria bacterium PA3]
MRVLIVGANGFVGHNLVQRILHTTDWEVCGVDLHDFRLREVLQHPRLRFHQVDISQSHALLAQEVQASDVVLPLAAVANPMAYVKEPLATFEIVFEENLHIARLCARHGARLVFPSTSEVYGLGEDAVFSEANSNPTFGPVDRERWIYAASKHLLERVIWALGKQGLRFTIFRPFNWFGPNLDDIHQGGNGGARVVTLFLGRMLRGEPIRLVDGGQQTRTFTYIDDGIDGLMAILTDTTGVSDSEIFNIGNPANYCSVEALAHQLARLVGEMTADPGFSTRVQFESIAASDYFGPNYQDTQHRRPSVDHIAAVLGWQPRVTLEVALRATVAWYLQHGAPVTALLAH